MAKQTSSCICADYCTHSRSFPRFRSTIQAIILLERRKCKDNAQVLWVPRAHGCKTTAVFGSNSLNHSNVSFEGRICIGTGRIRPSVVTCRIQARVVLLMIVSNLIPLHYPKREAKYQKGSLLQRASFW